MQTGIIQGPSPRIPKVEPETDRLKKACMDFESIFVNEMLKSADRGFSGDSGLLKGNDGKIIKSMFNETMAESLTSGNGIGLGNLLFEKLNIAEK
ncbi:MAG: rod-binding protein [Desulfotignum balticum]|uniref:Rod-binding protein n=1 Tax=Desulfotignum balticum TaxID=115781 RepID=A0A931CS63_9BACT|nr:rod-binding protein [Desulfotignum balticum]